MTVPSRPASVPSPSPTALGDFALQVHGTFYLGRAYHDLGDYRRAIDCPQAERGSPQGESAP